MVRGQGKQSGHTKHLMSVSEHLRATKPVALVRCWPVHYSLKCHRESMANSWRVYFNAYVWLPPLTSSPYHECIRLSK